jgi:hypothetical protein
MAQFYSSQNAEVTAAKKQLKVLFQERANKVRNTLNGGNGSSE